jgi:uridine kinase
MCATVVSISGPSGSGKSSIVKAVMNLLPNAYSLHFDDYKETTKFPENLTRWLSEGCNPNDFVTFKMVEDLKALRNQSGVSWVILEEPFGRGRIALSGLIDFVVCIDIPLEVAFARTIKRAACTVPENVEASVLIKSIIEFVDQYLTVSRDSYAIVNKNVKKDCNLVVDGTKQVDILANEIVTAVQTFLFR